ncbi:CHAT domain-containing protein [Thioflexithrix psekupsensis]|uniref:CHAT domain-containing protein n=2 Tax=Thioflexithrix psekupsensis TaxID=1570016 RepID=UPI001594D7F3|nr:CHAT domain-containing protein [Thioflexithrix psekupsensis]
MSLLASEIDVDQVIEQAQALRQQGQFHLPVSLLQAALARPNLSPAQHAGLWCELSELYRLRGELDAALTAVQKGLIWAERNENSFYNAQLLLQWGNLFNQQFEPELALEKYQQALTLAQENKQNGLIITVLLNILRTENELALTPSVQLDTIRFYLEKLTQDSEKLLPLIHLSQYTFLTQKQRYLLLIEAKEWAEKTQEWRLYSFILGHLGALYQENQQWTEAKQLTQQAIFHAQMWPDSLFRWQGQFAYLAQKQGDKLSAIAHYRLALTTLSRIRHLLYPSLTAKAFDAEIKPLYFNLLDLLFEQAKDESNPEKKQQLLQEIQTILENYRAIELENYYQDDCVTIQEQITNTHHFDLDTAIIYPILLTDRTEFLIKIGSQLYQMTQDQSARDIEALIHRFLTRRLAAVQAHLLYQHLILPIEPLLRQQAIKTLVIIPYGTLLKLPFAALKDDQGAYLIEHYALAIIPSLNLTHAATSDVSLIDVLAGGLSTAMLSFPALPAVSLELATLHQLFGGQLPLHNETFTYSQLAHDLNNKYYPLIHFATHSEFHSDAKRSFLLMYQEKLTLNQLEQLVRTHRWQQQPVELLTLSACETAVDSREETAEWRGALGLAGVAVKAGARRVLASLWRVDDRATQQFMAQFYQQLRDHPQQSHAVLLQQTQLALLKTEFNHPWYWSAFILIGNWL